MLVTPRAPGPRLRPQRSLALHRGLLFRISRAWTSGAGDRGAGGVHPAPLSPALCDAIHLPPPQDRLRGKRRFRSLCPHDPSGCRRRQGLPTSRKLGDAAGSWPQRPGSGGRASVPFGPARLRRRGGGGLPGFRLFMKEQAASGLGLTSCRRVSAPPHPAGGLPWPPFSLATKSRVFPSAPEPGSVSQFAQPSSVHAGPAQPHMACIGPRQPCPSARSQVLRPLLTSFSPENGLWRSEATHFLRGLMGAESPRGATWFPPASSGESPRTSVKTAPQPGPSRPVGAPAPLCTPYAPPSLPTPGRKSCDPDVGRAHKHSAVQPLPCVLGNFWNAPSCPLLRPG